MPYQGNGEASVPITEKEVNMRFDEYSSAELQMLSRKGGVASGKARRAKRIAIEREKVENIALSEMHAENERQRRENLRMIHEGTRLLIEVKHSLNRGL